MVIVGVDAHAAVRAVPRVREEATAVIREEVEGTATATAVAHEEHVVEDGAVERTLVRLLEGCRARVYELLAPADLLKLATFMISDKDVGFCRGVVVKLAQVQLNVRSDARLKVLFQTFAELHERLVHSIAEDHCQTIMAQDIPRKTVYIKDIANEEPSDSVCRLTKASKRQRQPEDYPMCRLKKASKGWR